MLVNVICDELILSSTYFCVGTANVLYEIVCLLAAVSLFDVAIPTIA